MPSTPLSDHAHTTTGWDVVDPLAAPERIATIGSCFLVGNGYLGYRGTLPDHRADDFVACVVSDTYDMADGVWRELCTVPNGLYVRIELDGEPLGRATDRPAQAVLDTGIGEVVMRWDGITATGARATLELRRIAGLHQRHSVVQELTITPDASTPITITAGVDDDVWSLNGDHFDSVTTEVDGDVVVSRCVTGERGTRISVACATGVDAPSETSHEPTVERSELGRGITAVRRIGDATAGRSITVTTAMGVAGSNDDDVDDPTITAVTACRRALGSGYASVLAASAAAWSDFWDTADVRVGGDLAAQAALRFSAYHNRVAIPAHSDRLPVGARGLSCQAYQGAAFWDQEMFTLPSVLFNHPEIARRLLVYRWRTLDGARRKAARLGFRGAYYAWISGDTGDELCPDFFFSDVITGRPIRNHFNVWQMHVSPDIAHTVWRYWDATADLDFLTDHGAEIVFEVARFLRSFVRWDEVQERYELIRLLGPDEWHENVDNNTYTARLSRLALRHAVAIHDELAARRPAALAELVDRLGIGPDELAAWRRIEARLFEHRPDPRTLLIEPFDGFFELEDCRPDDLRERLLDPGEYWGWPNGVAVHTQVSKQPDVVQLFAVDPSDPLEVQRANYDYFEPRCSHGSSLSHSVHATVAARLGAIDAGYLEQAEEYFMDTAALDLRTDTNHVVGGTFIGGMHTAAHGGAYQTAVFGFGGFSVTDGVMSVDPALPPTWTSIGYDAIVRGRRVTIDVDRSHVVVRASSGNDGTVTVRLRGGPEQEVAPGHRVEG